MHFSIELWLGHDDCTAFNWAFQQVLQLFGKQNCPSNHEHHSVPLLGLAVLFPIYIAQRIPYCLQSSANQSDGNGLPAQAEPASHSRGTNQLTSFSAKRIPSPSTAKTILGMSRKNTLLGWHHGAKAAECNANSENDDVTLKEFSPDPVEPSKVFRNFRYGPSKAVHSCTDANDDYNFIDFQFPKANQASRDKILTLELEMLDVYDEEGLPFLHGVIKSKVSLFKSDGLSVNGRSIRDMDICWAIRIAVTWMLLGFPDKSMTGSPSASGANM
jgi:hypothetical protein